MIFARYEIYERGKSTPIIGQCYDDSKRVFEVREDQTFMTITMRLNEDDWTDFKTNKLEAARYKKSTFVYEDMKGVNHTVRFVDDEIVLSLIGVNINGKKIYRVTFRAREEP